MGLALLAARLIIAGIFLRSGLAKANGLADFRSAVSNYRLLPPSLVTVVAAILPFAEIAAAVLLAAGILTVVVASVLALLLVAFAVAIAVNLARGRVFDCGCAGATAPRMIRWRHVAADLVLAAVAAAVAVAPPAAAQAWRGPAGLVRLSTPPGATFPIVTAVVVSLVMMAVLRRAVAVRSLAAAAARQSHGDPFSATSGRH
ncbi:MAG TPA: MauE/DoxX family redox-associated membrane protein [Streptosporangiaceae bacterium]|nr:MauE/DoxX family redox-associated membrane protein [Streptosporangiaceae bacterium]